MAKKKIVDKLLGRAKNRDIRPARTCQEFYCGECSGYFLVHVNRALNHEILVRCPKPSCRHEHRRVIKDGTIYEQGRGGSATSGVKETLITSMATYSKTSRTEMGKEKGDNYHSRRDGKPLTAAQKERWLEVAERERSGAMFDD